MSHPDHNDLDRLLGGSRPPAPPEALRSRVLGAAAAARPKPDRWADLWHHRGLRLGWAAAVVLLLAGHLVLPSGDDAVDPRSGAAVIAASPADAIADFLRPVEISADARPLLGRMAPADGILNIETRGDDT